MKKVLIILALLMVYPTLSNCQERHNFWYGQFDLRSNSLLLPVCANVADIVLFQIVPAIPGSAQISRHIDDSDFNPDSFSSIERGLANRLDWLFIESAYDIHVPQWKLYDGDNKVATQGPDWWRCLLFGDFQHNYNISVGYSVHWRSIDVPFGAKIGINYEWRGVCVTEGELAGLHKTSGIVPSVSLTWFMLGNNFEVNDSWNIFAEAGTSYVASLVYNDPLQLGKDKVNNGWRIQTALGFKYRRLCFSIKYEWNLYDYFNIPNLRSRLNDLMLSFGFMY